MIFVCGYIVVDVATGSGISLELVYCEHEAEERIGVSSWAHVALSRTYAAGQTDMDFEECLLRLAAR